ncbi:MAG: type II toxin-antitoxin system death-on-curing family toxin [Patescibacteria group bacterium]
MKGISLVEVEYIAHRLAQQFLKWNEPIPEFGSRFPHVLESCLAMPFQTFAQRKLYHGLIGKAAVLFYLLIKNHPFQNGNKRVAMTTLLYFLYKNNKWLRVDEREVYLFAKWVAESNAKVKDETIRAIEKLLTTYIVSLNP